MSSVNEVQNNLSYAENVLAAILQMKSFGVNVYSMQITLRQLITELSTCELDAQDLDRMKQMEAAVQSNLDPFFSIQFKASVRA